MDSRFFFFILNSSVGLCNAFNSRHKSVWSSRCGCDSFHGKRVLQYYTTILGCIGCWYISWRCSTSSASTCMTQFDKNSQNYTLPIDRFSTLQAMETFSNDSDPHITMTLKGLVASLGVLFFFLFERLLTMIAEWRKAIEKKEKPSSRVRVMRDPELTAKQKSASGKECKHKYSSYPYCYDEIAKDTKDDHHHHKNGQSPVASDSQNHNNKNHHQVSQLFQVTFFCSQLKMP